MNLSKQIAYACALVPMLLGVSIFLLWLNWRSPIFQSAGLAMIVIGLILLLPGGVAFGNYVRLARQGDGQRSIWRQWSLYLIPCLLLVNLPLAAGLASAAIYLENETRVTITNRTAHRLDDHTLTGGDVTFELPPLDPGESVTRTFHPAADGSFVYRWRAGDSDSAESFGYFTPGLGGSWQVEVQADEITVQQR